MSHVDEGMLTAYVDNALSMAEKSGVDAHLSACAACRARLDEARRLAGRAHEILAGAAPAFSPPPTFDDLAARSRGIDDRKGLEGMSRLAWAASLALAIGLGWYVRGIVRQPPGDLAVQPESSSIAAARPGLTPAPSPLRGEGSASGDRSTTRRGEGGASLDRLASRKGEGKSDRRTADVSGDRTAEQDAKALNRPASPALATGGAAELHLATKADSTTVVSGVAQAARTNAGAGAGAASGTGPIGAGAPTERQARAVPTLQMQDAPRVSAASEPASPEGRLFKVAGLDVIRQVALPGGLAARTVQRIDVNHTIELIQDPPGGKARQNAAADSSRIRPDSMTSITIERGGYRITAWAAISADSLRALLSKLR